MTEEDLEFVVVATRHERYRVLVSDDHPDRDYWRRAVARRAAEMRSEAPPPGLVASAPAPRPRPDDAVLIAAVRRCPHRGRMLPPRDGCGCSELFPCAAGRGTLDGGAVARSSDCAACVRAGGPPAIARE